MFGELLHGDIRERDRPNTPGGLRWAERRIALAGRDELTVHGQCPPEHVEPVDGQSGGFTLTKPGGRPEGERYPEPGRGSSPEGVEFVESEWHNGCRFHLWPLRPMRRIGGEQSVGNG